MAEPKPNVSQELPVSAAVAKSRKLATRIPRLILEARRVASTVIHGLHGRRRAGSGENFWQYRRFMSGEPAQSIDWRRSARDDHLYVREREWEASHTIWLWADRSPSMEFSSSLTEWSKLDRALVVSFALAEVLVQGGERVGIPELMRPTANRNVIETMAQRIVHDPSERPSLPPNFSPAPFSEVLLLSDFWSPVAEFRKTIGQLAANGARGHVVQVVDPAEESFPYSGRVEFVESEGLGSVTAGRAETWSDDYQELLARHRPALPAQTEQYVCTFTVPRPELGPTERLSALHARVGANAMQSAVNSRHAPAQRGSAA